MVKPYHHAPVHHHVQHQHGGAAPAPVRLHPTAFFIDCRLYREPVNSINWKERLKAHFYPPQDEVERDPWDYGSGWRHSWRLLYSKTNLNKDPELLETEKWNDDPQTQCAHVRDLFQRRKIVWNDDVKKAPAIPKTQHGFPASYFQTIRMDGLRGIDWIYDTASEIWFRCSTYIRPTMKYPEFVEGDQQMSCSVWEKKNRDDGKCGMLAKWCNYNSLTMRTQCVEKAEAFPETSTPFPPYRDKQQCVYLGDQDERIPRDSTGVHASYEVYFI